MHVCRQTPESYGCMRTLAMYVCTTSQLAWSLYLVTARLPKRGSPGGSKNLSNQAAAPVVHLCVNKVDRHGFSLHTVPGYDNMIYHN